MISPTISEARTVPRPAGPYLSHSRIAKYLHCPEQYRLYYVENLRPKVQDASLVFGKVIHEALEALFRYEQDPVACFRKRWTGLQSVTLAYKERESWEKLFAIGTALLEKFVRDELPRIGTVRAVERSFTLTITSLDVPLVGVIDLVADLDAEPTVIDFKTAAASYQPHEAALSDQLTAYQLAEPEVTQTAFCVFVKTKDPKVEWYMGVRHPIDLTEYLAKVKHLAGEIVAGHFYKRPGKWCSYCDYLPVCLGDEQKTRDTLVQVAPHQ
jgi:RecB family exonuclease